MAPEPLVLFSRIGGGCYLVCVGGGGCRISPVLGSFLPVMSTNDSKCPLQKLPCSQRTTTIVIPWVAWVESQTEFVLKNYLVDSLKKWEVFAFLSSLEKSGHLATLGDRPTRAATVGRWIAAEVRQPCSLVVHHGSTQRSTAPAL